MIERINAALEGRYSIERELGEGGMAFVYLATDLKHDRSVALKVLKEDLAAVLGEERFLDEIRTTAKLQHPNILPLFDSGAADGFLFYAMPYVQGETLREKLTREVQLPVEDAIELVQKIAGALDYAHEEGIVHRDIKPSNVLLSSGEPLIADFGIALAVSQANDGRRTETGLSLGTPHYMSPEQAAGDRSLDPRSDVYALGCVLQELLTGEPPFSGANAQAVLARILTTRPTPVTTLRPTVPPHVESAIAKALEKLPADRFKSAKDFRKALGDSDFRHTVVERTMGSTAVPTQTRVVREGVKTPVVAGIGVAALAVGLIAGAVVLGGDGGTRADAMDGPSIRTTMDIGDRELRNRLSEVVVSPDGSRFAYAGYDENGQGAIYWRPADDLEYRLIPGTEQNSRRIDIAFSPDGEWIAWANNERLMKVSLLGGAPTPVVPSGDILARLLDWSVPGTIVFWAGTPDGPGLYRIADNGGTPTRLIGGPEWPDTYSPQLLPDESGVLFSDIETDRVAVYIFSDDSVRVLLEGGIDATYVPETSHILYTDRSGGLWATHFDLGRHELTGEARPVFQGLATETAWSRYSVASNGTLVVGTGAVLTNDFLGSGSLELVVVDLGGTATPLELEPRSARRPQWDPEGRRIAFFGLLPGQDADSTQIFVYDLERQNVPRPITTTGSNGWPAWSPDGQSIAFTSERDGSESTDVYIKDDWRDDRPPRQALALDGAQRVFGWPTLDRVLLEQGPGATSVYSLVLGSDSAGFELYYDPEADVDEPTLSPDGEWVAYNSDESGQEEIYVRRYPDSGLETQVSEAGGQMPNWSPSGDTLYYQCGSTNEELCGAALEFEPAPSVLSTWTIMPFPYRDFDLHPDGDRFIATRLAETIVEESTGDEVPEQHIVIHNWFNELRRIMGEGN